jgi:hypothetical protein
VGSNSPGTGRSNRGRSPPAVARMDARFRIVSSTPAVWTPGDRGAVALRRW